VSVGDVGEFGLIARIAARLGAQPSPTGPGDDAAVLPAPDGLLVVTTDLLAEGVHFRRDWSTPHDVGVKAAAANLADVAAMGAVPTALLLGIALPAATELAWVDGFVDGLRAEATRGGAKVVGGDTIASSDRITLAITALGDLRGRPPVTRTGTAPGMLVLAGVLGHSAAGLRSLRGSASCWRRTVRRSPPTRWGRCSRARARAACATSAMGSWPTWGICWEIGSARSCRCRRTRCWRGRRRCSGWIRGRGS
jgi:thiamine-monophosphate kinase